MERSDSDLIEASLRGERAAFGQIVERYQGMVCAVGYSATGNRSLSEDIAQDAFITAWSKLADLREASKLRSWLAGIARNLSLKALRKSSREEPLTEDALGVAEASPLDETIEAESEALVWRALRSLPERNREAMVLYYCEHQSAKAVATTLELSEDAVMQRLSRGRAQLKEKVASIVESQLTSAKPRRGFAAAVVLALPTFGSLSHAQAGANSAAATTSQTSSGGIGMFKIAIIAAAVSTVGVGTYWVATDNDSNAAPQTAKTLTANGKVVDNGPTSTSTSTSTNTNTKADTSDNRERPTLAKQRQTAPDWITSLRIENADLSTVPDGHMKIRECLVAGFGNRGSVTLAITVADGDVAGVQATALEKDDVPALEATLPTAVETCLLAVLGTLTVEQDSDSPANTPTLTFAWRDDNERQPDGDLVAEVAIDDRRARGPKDAPVTIVVYHDFTCHYCGKVLGTIDELFDDYPGKLRLVVKQFPVNPSAQLAHQAALAASDQGKFWEMHDLIMANQGDLSEEALVGLASQLKLDLSQFKEALSSGAFIDDVKADIEEGLGLGVKGTPTFLINGRRYVGARSIDYFRAKIDEALAN